MNVRRLMSMLLVGATLAAGAAVTMATNAVAATCPAANGDPYSTAVLGDGPIAYYRLNETGGTEMCDSSTHANAGTYTGPDLTFGVSGPILSGTDTGVGAGGSGGIGQSGAGPSGEITGNTSFTLEGWFKSTGTSQNQALVAMGGNASGQLVGLTTWNDAGCGPSNAYSYASTLGLDEDGSSNCWNTEYADNGTGSPIDIYDGSWHFLAVAYDESADTVTAYVDGQSLQSQTPTVGLDLASGPIRVGGWVNSDLDKPLIGDASEVAVFPSALTADQIAAEYEDAVPSLGFATQSYDAEVSAAQGTTAGLPITITRSTHATGAVTLTVDGLPTGVTVTGGTSIPAGSSSTTLGFSIASDAALGGNPITIDATSPDTAEGALSGYFTVTGASATPPTDTGTAVSCEPQLTPDGTASTCTATVTGSGASAPTGAVSFTASPSTGTFSDAAACTLTAGANDTSSCGLTFTPSTGGGYTIDGDYLGDDADSASDGSGSFVALDPTSTSLSCPASGITVGDPFTCTATVTDTAGTQGMYGSVEFATTPSASGSLDPGQCTENTTGSETTVSCPVQFTPPQTGSYTISAIYCGDAGATAPAVCSGDETSWGGDHAPSSGSAAVTANLTPSGTTGPVTTGGTGPGGSSGGNPSGPGSPGGKPPAGGLIKLGAKLSVSHRNRVIVPLTCKGVRGAKCTGTVALDIAVEVVTKAPTLGGRGKRTKYTVELGSATFSVKAPSSTSVRLKLTKTALKIFKVTGKKPLAVTATATEFGVVVVEQRAKLTTKGHAPKRKRKHRHKRKK